MASRVFARDGLADFLADQEIAFDRFDDGCELFDEFAGQRPTQVAALQRATGVVGEFASQIGKGFSGAGAFVMMSGLMPAGG